MSDYELLTTVPKGAVVKGWTRGVAIEEQALDQLRRVATLPFIFKHVAVMPDAHWGMGACVGSVIPVRGAVVPAAVGVDIGCGMVASRLNVTRRDLADREWKIYDAIRKAIPTGRTDNGGPRDQGGWDGFQHCGGEIPPQVKVSWKNGLQEEYNALIEEFPGLARAKSLVHLGTLGTGNHFIELSEDEVGQAWLVIHSGSRGIGNRIGQEFTALAKKECERWFVDLPDPNLAYLPAGTEGYDGYIRATKWAQKFAKYNRLLMTGLALDAIGLGVIATDVVHCHHNYVAWEHHYGQNVQVIRKGAIRARKGDRGIIPGSMGERSFIVVGKGNPESFTSASHGAGRVMSRTQARREISQEDHILRTEGVVCDKSTEVIDESPAAYKDIDAVMAAQESLVGIQHVLKAFVNVKGVGDNKRRKK